LAKAEGREYGYSHHSNNGLLLALFPKVIRIAELHAVFSSLEDVYHQIKKKFKKNSPILFLLND
jgi:hypothetical protein